MSETLNIMMSTAMSTAMSTTMSKPARSTASRSHGTVAAVRGVGHGAPAERGVGARGDMVRSQRYATMAATHGAGLNDKE
jgi:hypothetical protein